MARSCSALLFKAVFVYGNQFPGAGKDLRRAPVVDGKLHPSGLWIVLLKAQHKLRPRAAEGIDGLIVVPHHEQVVFRQGEHAQNFVLHGVDVLKFVHQNISELFLPGCKNGRILQKKIPAFQHHVVKIQLPPLLRLPAVGGIDGEELFL